MDFKRFENNLISVIKEAQIKLGYESMPIGVNYTLRSLSHLLRVTEEEEIYRCLIAFSKERESVFGKIDIRKNEKGYRLDVSSKGADYVHSLLSENEFLYAFISEIRKPSATVESILNIFKRYSDKVHFEEVDNGEFDYLIYFEEEGIDDFWYCLHDDDLMLEYHRFIKEDYLDFEF